MIQWISHLRKGSLSIEKAQFLGFSKWQKDFSSNGQWYGVQFHFSNTPTGFANFLLILPIQEPQPDELDVLIESYLGEKH